MDNGFYELAGQLPKTIYAVKVRGKDSSGRGFSRIHFFALRSDYMKIMETLDKYPDNLTISTYEGKVEWKP